MVKQHLIDRVRARLSRDKGVGSRGIKDTQAQRLYPEEEDMDIRPFFFRDVDRIVHSKAYARYIDKTQVFFEVKNANITHRSLHVLLVSRTSRQIGRALKLNTDLIEAISLAHDIGHAPYGHPGEEYLNEISNECGIGTFLHNAQGVRWLAELEKRFPTQPAKGLNLTLQVYDGILCHDGETFERELKPKKINGKTWESHFKEYNDSFLGNKFVRIPMSYEGIAVRFADIIAYIGRDIEDAILLKFIQRIDIPENCRKVLGDTNRKIMNTLIRNLLAYSIENETIGYDENIFSALKELKEFNYENIYEKRDKKSNEQHESIRKDFHLMFEVFQKDLEKSNYNSPVFKDHIDYIDDKNYSSYYKKYKIEDKLGWIVRDYIAGMRDGNFKEMTEWVKKKN